MARRGPPVSTQVPADQHGREAEHHDRDREDDPDAGQAGVEVLDQRGLVHAAGVDLTDAQMDSQCRRRDEPPVVAGGCDRAFRARAGSSVAMETSEMDWRGNSSHDPENVEPPETNVASVDGGWRPVTCGGGGRSVDRHRPLPRQPEPPGPLSGSPQTHPRSGAHRHGGGIQRGPGEDDAVRPPAGPQVLAVVGAVDGQGRAEPCGAASEVAVGRGPAAGARRGNGPGRGPRPPHRRGAARPGPCPPHRPPRCSSGACRR